MNCPICNAWTEVKETRKKPEGYVRYRCCGNGHRFKTVEVVVNDKI